MGVSFVLAGALYFGKCLLFVKVTNIPIVHMADGGFMVRLLGGPPLLDSLISRKQIVLV